METAAIAQTSVAQAAQAVGAQVQTATLAKALDLQQELIGTLLASLGVGTLVDVTA